MNLKKCTKCEQEFEATTEFFHRHNDKFHPWCKSCKNIDRKKYEERYKGKYKEQKKEYRDKNKEKIKEWHKQNYQENKERLLEQSKIQYKKTSDKVCARTKKYREDNPEWYREYKRGWYGRNKLRCTMSRGVWGCLSGRQKSSRTFDYIGCTVEELWLHLESQFQNGMTRENYGEWHVDHIVPLYSFDFDNDLENNLKIAWHYTNLQPLWAKDNLSKGKNFNKGK
jgi:hypothetical protein